MQGLSTRRRLSQLTLIGIVGLLASIATTAAAESMHFCQTDISAGSPSAERVATLATHGGLVRIFEHRVSIARPYDCAKYYLDGGLDINEIDPRDPHESLTPLAYAIKFNNTRMVQFLIAHGADLQKPAGPADLKPLAYAYHLAMANTSINRNVVIGILNDALTDQGQ